MKNILLLFTFFFVLNTLAQQSKVTKNANGDLIGVTSRTDYDQQPYTRWFQRNYDKYSLGQNTIKELKKALKKVTIKGFMGTWCADSRREVPKFYKLLSLTSFDLKNLEMISLNRSKRTPDNLQNGYEIIRIPTFIFYKEGKEIGRFVEYPRETLEQDFLKILTREKYKQSDDRTK